MAFSPPRRLSRARLKRQSRPGKDGFARKALRSENSGGSDRHGEEYRASIALVNAVDGLVPAIVATASQARAFLRGGAL